MDYCLHDVRRHGMNAVERYLAPAPAAARVGGMDVRQPSPEEASELAATTIRACLRRGAAERIAYVEPGQEGRPVGGSRALAPARRAGRNDPCPCGSGRKYKRCCGQPE